MRDGVSERANMAGDTQGIISTGTAESKPQNLPTGSIRLCSDLPNGLESHANTSNLCGKAHSNANGLRKSAKMSVTSDLTSGAEPRVGKPERPRDEMDVLGTHARRALPPIRIHLKMCQ